MHLFRARIMVIPLFLFLVGPLVAAPRLTDVTALSGLKIADNTGVGGTNPHGVAVEDFNGDGLADILIVTFHKPHVRYFRNKGNLRFADVTRGSGLENFEGDGTGAAVADFDRDGKPDVYLTSLRKGASRLYRNKGNGTFEDVSARAGVLVPTARSCAWSDVNGDGWPDLYVTNPSGANHLFINNKGMFSDRAREAGLELANRHSLSCAFGDVDGDGLDDLFVTNYQSQVCALFRSLGKGKFQEITAEAGLGRRASSVGCVFGDIFNRGRLDLYVTTDSWLAGANYTEAQMLKRKHTVEPNVLYGNDGKGRFTPLKVPEANYKTLSHDAVLEDLDHDGLVDIYVGVDAQSGNKWATSKGGNPLWTRAGGKEWKEVGKQAGVKYEGNCVCVPAADLDNDGDLDLLLVNFYSNVVLYRNETNDRNWLRVKAVGTESNLDGIGARVWVHVEGGDRRLVGFREVQSGAGYGRCSPLEVHFGLGKKPAAGYRVEVFFPATKKRIVKEKVRPGQRLVVKEPAD
jgi:enediyne biosynthesis protein E4